MPPIDVTDHDFADAVLDRSYQVPVLVDFWAPWCGPCRVLGPVLDKLAEPYAGRVDFAKLNTDDNQATAQRYRVSSIPAVKLFRDGAVTAEFVSALPEAKIRAFLDQHVPSPADRLASDAQRALDAGAVGTAGAAADQALAIDARQPRALLVRSLLDLRAGALDEAAVRATSIPASAAEWDTAQAVLQATALARLADAAGGRAAARARAAAAPDDPDALLAAAGALIADGDHRAALDILVRLVERDRRWRDEAARKAMLTVFALLGARHPLADEYRRKLAILL